MLFNVNHYVRVKLTQVGLDELKRQHDELYAKVPSIHAWKPPVTDKDGWSKHQLWSLMQDLGHLCGLGRATPFETTIEIIEGQR